MLGSHLQKYKLKIQRKYDLASLDEIQDWMFVSEDCAIESIANMWRNPFFQGLDAARLHALVEERARFLKNAE